MKFVRRPLAHERSLAHTFARADPPSAENDGTAPQTTLQTVLDRLLADRGAVRVLDVGCGRRGRVTLPARAYVVGLDISAEELDRNDGLDEKVVGDVQTYRFPASTFDVVICWELLEHVALPRRALENLCHALKEDGLLVLALPNVLSLKGLITKFTPHWFHIWVYRHVFQSSFTPFPTVMSFSIAPTAIKRFAREKGLSVEYFHIEESYQLKAIRARLRLDGWRWTLIQRALKTLSLGRVDADLTDLQMVLRKLPWAQPQHKRGVNAEAGVAVTDFRAESKRTARALGAPSDLCAGSREG